jgi:hypothetical protein
MVRVMVILGKLFEMLDECRDVIHEKEQSFVRETIISFRGCLPLAVVIERIPGFLLFFLRFAGTLPIIEMSTATLGWSCCAEGDAWGNVRLYSARL